MNNEYQFKNPDTTVILEPDRVIFRRRLVDPTINVHMRGDSVVLYSDVTGIRWQAPTFGSPGFLQLSAPGQKTTTAWFGLDDAMDQPQFGVTFNKKKLAEAEELKKQLETRTGQKAAASE